MVGTVSADLGTYKRMATVTLLVVEKDASAPTPTAIKIGTDVETNRDLYANAVYSWVTA